MSIYELKPRFQNLLRPLVRGLHALGVRPNHVTGATLAGCLAFAALLHLGAGDRRLWLLLPLVLFLRMAANAIDGMLAREFDLRSLEGALLNELGDVASDAALCLPFAALPGVHFELVFCVAAGAALCEMAGVLAETIGGQRRYDGPLGKSDRAFVLGTCGLALGLGAPLGPWIDILLAAMVVLLVPTILRRCRAGLRAAATRTGHQEP